MPFLGPLIGLAGSAIAGIFGGKGRRQRRNASQDAIQQANAVADELLRSYGLPQNDEYRELLFQTIDGEGFTPETSRVLDEVRATNPQVYADIQGVVQGTTQAPPDISAGVASVNQQTAQIRDRANDVLNRGGFSPELQQAFGQASRIGAGETGAQQNAFRAFTDILNSEDLQRAGSVGNWFIERGGVTPESRALFHFLQDRVSEGGRDSELRELQSTFQGLLDSGGMTPALRELQGQLQQQIQSGGLTPEGRQVLGQMQQLIQSGGRGGALMDFDQALGMAADEGAALAQGQQESIRRQALSRGAQAGSVVGGGLQNQALREGSDQVLQTRAQGMRDAARTQQTLQLQQLGLASGTAAQILDQASRVVTAATSGLGDVARSSSANLGSAISGSVGLEQVAAGRLATNLNALNTVMQQDIQRLGVGRDLLSLNTNARLGAGGGLAGLAGLQLQGALGAGGIAGQAAGNNLAAIGQLQNAAGLDLGALDTLNRSRGIQTQGQLGAGQQMLNNLALQQSIAGQSQQNFMNAIAGLGQNSQNFLNQSMNTFRTGVGAIGGIPTEPGGLANLGNTLAQFGAGVTQAGGFGELFGRGQQGRGT